MYKGLLSPECEENRCVFIWGVHLQKRDKTELKKGLDNFWEVWYTVWKSDLE